MGGGAQGGGKMGSGQPGGMQSGNGTGGDASGNAGGGMSLPGRHNRWSGKCTPDAGWNTGRGTGYA